ncbi:MAG TPA: hypothetical protein EYG13_05560 [Dehalococcoidia bacterium]|nr:hypothetical protein [Dehalococcoidia bacterium]
MTTHFYSRFNRWILPGFAFTGVVIGGGYSTGRELAEFFLPSGPWGGILGMLLAMVVWSLICTLTFMFARSTNSMDYRTFFGQLLGPGWVVFEGAYLCLVIVMLSVFAAAAGAIGAAVFHWPTIAGTLLLILLIAAVSAFGNESVERMFKYVTLFVYAIFAVFIVLSLTHFSDRIVDGLTTPYPTTGWVLGGLTYSVYNAVSAIVILPALRHQKSRKDAVIAGMLCGPLAMLPALLFLVCMVAYYPSIAAEPLPSDFLLRKLQLPVFHALFQLMIFSALLETGIGSVHAINERVALVARARGRSFGNRARLLLAGAVLITSVFVAARFGLVDLIARGYRFLAYVFMAVYVVPLVTYGVWRLIQRGERVS